MTRALLILTSQGVRERAIDWIRKAPVNTRVEFKKPRRTLAQNDKMWAMLTEISGKAKYHGRRLTPAHWKAVFMQGLEREIDVVPSLDGKSFVQLNNSSSDLSLEEMSMLIEIIHAYCAREGIEIKEQNNEH